MRTKIAYILFALCLTVWIGPVALSADREPTRVKIAVDIQMGFQACIDFWQPVADYLSDTIPEHRFVIVPIASREDLTKTLDQGNIAFAILNPAMMIAAEDQFEMVPLATMVESVNIQNKAIDSDTMIAGAVIRRADRLDLKTLDDIHNQRIAAVKPWSLTGWIAQWGLFEQKGLRASKDFQQIVFDGTDTQVIERVLDGSADVGTVDAWLLSQMLHAGRIKANSLFVFDHLGQAIPLTDGQEVMTTDTYPGWVFSKSKHTSDSLARQTLDALMNRSIATNVDGMPCEIAWTIPHNYAPVRHLLQELMGPDYAKSSGYPVSRGHPIWLMPASVMVMALALLGLILIVMRSQYAGRERVLRRRLEDTQKELVEVRAQKQRIDMILAQAGCGIDIIDEQNRVVYADTTMERKYGDWHGRKCYEYYCGADQPCDECRRPGPTDEQHEQVHVQDINGSSWEKTEDPHARVHFVKGQPVRMIGIPFHDEGGRWLYARIHFPLSAFEEKADRTPQEMAESGMK